MMLWEWVHAKAVMDGLRIQVWTTTLTRLAVTMLLQQFTENAFFSQL